MGKMKCRKSIFFAFMSFLDGTNYSTRDSFSTKKKEAITPNDIVKYFKWKAFKYDDNREIDPVTDKSEFSRVRSLEVYKKSISFF
jgi:hypothetical protein